jgi:hypothetical protein
MMNDPPPPGQPLPPAGWCDRCRFGRRIVSDRGAEFLICDRSRLDPAYPRYPRLPVLSCAGFASGSAGEPCE